MSKELIAEAREHHPTLFLASGARELITRLADALEATIQEEPNVDIKTSTKVLDTLAYYHCRATNPKADHSRMGYHTFSEEQREHLREYQREAEVCGSPATFGTCVLAQTHNIGQANVPENHKSGIEVERDAAIELLNAHKCHDSAERAYERTLQAEAERDDLVKRLSKYLWHSTGGMLSKANYDELTMITYTEEYFEEVYAEAHKEIEAERDAALAAIERVRAIHAPSSSLTWGAPDEFQVCEECNDPDARDFIYWPCPTIQALDGAPEPEVAELPETGLEVRDGDGDLVMSGEHRKVLHQGMYVCDSCVNDLGLNVRWDRAGFMEGHPNPRRNHEPE